VHGGENAIRSGLQRQMKMLGNAIRGSEEIDQIASDIHGLEGTDAKTFERRTIANLTQQISELDAGSKVAAVTAEIDPTQNDFLETSGAQFMDFAEHLVRRKAAASSAHKWNHTVGTAIIAAILNLQNRTGMSVLTAEDWRGQPRVALENIASENFWVGLAEEMSARSEAFERDELGVRRSIVRCGISACVEQSRDFGFVRIPDNPGDPFESGNFVRRALRVTAGDHNLRVRIGAMNVANGLTCLGVGRRSDRTSVYDDDLSLGTGVRE
jgi:hypothetical protein